MTQASAAALFAEASRLFAAGRVAEAERQCQAALALDPGHARGLHLMGVIAYRAGRNDQAVALMSAAAGVDDRDPSLHNNLANALAEAGQIDLARRHYERAVALAPEHVEALYNLGNALASLSRWSEAIAFYRRALALRPDFVDAWINQARAQMALGAPAEALACCDHALALHPHRAGLHGNRGLALVALDRFDEAMASYASALVLDPAAADIHGNIGTALVERGRIAEAVAAFDRGLALAPRNAKLYFCRVQAKRVTSDDPHLAGMEALMKDPAGLSDEARVDLHFALAKAYTDLGRADDAFALLGAGNALKRKSVTYNEAATLERFEQTLRTVTPDVVTRLAGAGHPSKRPIFILGMPRSGSTLVEQILAAHPDVVAGGELPNLQNAVAGILGPDRDFPPETLPAADQAALLRRIADRYLASLDGIAGGAARLTDKMPPNFAFAGLIHLALPHARIIHTRREPLDVGLSCFATLFTNVPYAYDLAEIGRYWRAYDRLMRHWHAVLPKGAILDVDYETLVMDFEGQVRRILDFCGLPWHQDCLAFQSAPHAVRTASAAQVRQPLYRSAVARARALAPALLEPLRAALFD